MKKLIFFLLAIAISVGAWAQKADVSLEPTDVVESYENYMGVQAWRLKVNTVALKSAGFRKVKQQWVKGSTSVRVRGTEMDKRVIIRFADAVQARKFLDSFATLEWTDKDYEGKKMVDKYVSGFFDGDLTAKLTGTTVTISF